MSIVALAVFGLFFAGILFVIRNFVLGEQFNLVNEIIQSVVVLVAVMGAGILTRKIAKKDAPVKANIKV